MIEVNETEIDPNTVVLVAVPAQSKVDARGHGYSSTVGRGIGLRYLSFVRDNLKRKRPGYKIDDVRGALLYFEAWLVKLNSENNYCHDRKMRPDLVANIAHRCVKKAHPCERVCDDVMNNSQFNLSSIEDYRSVSIGTTGLDKLLQRALDVKIHEVLTPLTGDSEYEQDPFRMSRDDMQKQLTFISKTLAAAGDEIAEKATFGVSGTVHTVLKIGYDSIDSSRPGSAIGFYWLPDDESWIMNVDFGAIETPELRSYRYNVETGNWDVYRLSTEEVGEYKIGAGLLADTSSDTEEV